MIAKPPYGLYDALIDEHLQSLLAKFPDLRSVFGKLDPEEQPARYASFIAKILEQCLREETDPENRRQICNDIVCFIEKIPKKSHFETHRLIAASKPLLLEITPPHYGDSGLPRPATPISESSLFTGSPREPQLAHELTEEMRSSDGVDILMSFIKWSGLRLLMPGFEDLRDRRVTVRIITTSYMGASDAPAVEWLSKMPNVEVRVSYDTDRTRLHAKAYHFKRLSGYSTAYIGSANMSQAAISRGLEWNLKITRQDMGHILEKFSAEFETYWNSREFISLDPEDPLPLRKALSHAARNRNGKGPAVFFDLRPHPFQERIIEALERERNVRNQWRNLVIAATGTGKTVISAFDYQRFCAREQRRPRLLFIAHREEILKQVLATFRNVFRDNTFGDLLVGQHEPDRMDHLFCSVTMMTGRRLWKQVGHTFYEYIVIDEAHHGTAASYRPIFENFSPSILLGLTATPERMDGGTVAADFGNYFAAEIRLPEALEEKLLCPFHYFGVADSVDLSQDNFWKNGRYDMTELEKVYTGAHALARQRLDMILESLTRYEPDLSSVKGVGFCVSIQHAHFMAKMFTERGIPSGAVVSDVTTIQCAAILDELKSGHLTFVFTVDKLSEGLDIPDINVVLFLRPTESLTVFLQQLGRGLRHAPGKDCLTVLDFVGQAHRRYRMDTKFKALLPRYRFSIEREVEHDFPHLPAGCSIQLDRLSRQYVLENIRTNLRNLAVQIPERLRSFEADTNGQPLTFGNFIRHHDYAPEQLLVAETWSGWKAKAQMVPVPRDPNLLLLKQALVRAAFISGPVEIARLRKVIQAMNKEDVKTAMDLSGDKIASIYYRVWADTGNRFGFTSFEESLRQLAKNPSILKDLDEILAWAETETQVDGIVPGLSFTCNLELHAQYGSRDIQAALGSATLESAGQRGVGVIHFPEIKTYALLITFQKTEKEFSPSTMYADYPISRDLLHWESQSNTTQESPTGQNLIHHHRHHYTILIFARDKKRHNNCVVPFVYLGPAAQAGFESERPIRMIWRLTYPMPVEMFEENRRGG